MEYQKQSYKLFILWIGLFFVLFYSLVFLDISDSLLIKIEIMVLNIALLILFIIIYITESIYWINGVSYKEAKAMTSDQRKHYAMEHFKLFLKCTLVTLIYCIISYFLKISMFIDILISTIILIITAISSIRIKV